MATKKKAVKRKTKKVVKPKAFDLSEAKKSYVVFVLDESSSMGMMREEAIAAFNQQRLDVQKNVRGTGISTRVSLVKFATEVPEPIYWNKGVTKIKKLGFSGYRPHGMTAMLDAVGTSIDRLLEEPDINDENTAVLFVVISDGEENNSKEFNYRTLGVKIKELQESGRWTFTYSGANQDLSRLKSELNIPVGNFQKWAPTRASLKKSSYMRSNANDAYFNTLSNSVSAVNHTSDFYSSVGATDATEDEDKTTSKSSS